MWTDSAIKLLYRIRVSKPRIGSPKIFILNFYVDCSVLSEPQTVNFQ